MIHKKIYIFIIVIIVFHNNVFCSHSSCSIDTMLVNKLELLKQYADNYHPISMVEDKIDIATLPMPDALTADAIEYVWERDSAEVEKFVLVIILKLYKSHVICCRQSYYICSDSECDTNANPIFNYFMKSIGFVDFKPGSLEDYVNYGPITSSMAYAYVSENKKLLKYKPIYDEYKQISKILKRLKLLDED